MAITYLWSIIFFPEWLICDSLSYVTYVCLADEIELLGVFLFPISVWICPPSVFLALYLNLSLGTHSSSLPCKSIFSTICHNVWRQISFQKHLCVHCLHFCVLLVSQLWRKLAFQFPSNHSLMSYFLLILWWLEFRIASGPLIFCLLFSSYFSQLSTSNYHVASEYKWYLWKVCCRPKLWFWKSSFKFLVK